MTQRPIVRGWPLLALLLALASLAGCATTRAMPVCDDAAADPFEPVNRRVFAFDLTLDRVLIKPAAEAYRAVLPEVVRERIHSMLDNLKEPLIFANDVLQGRGDAAAITGKRFVVNSTLGLAGLFDRASGFGLAKQSGDFGQTLYAWGVDDGPYLVLPLFGPSNLRDTVGLGVEFYASPTGQIGSSGVRHDVSLSTGIADGLDLRSRNIETLEELEKNSLDFYAYLRSVTRQNRRAILLAATGQADPCRSAGEELVDPGAATPAGGAASAVGLTIALPPPSPPGATP
ncbi:MAG: VacJ family lipoprotein [Pseudomonadota bacterium]|nr:VacJ family lipoprotein [Pseudomonadota bacterium]